MAMPSKSSSEACRLHSCLGLAKLSEGMVASDERFKMLCQCTRCGDTLAALWRRGYKGLGIPDKCGNSLLLACVWLLVKGQRLCLKPHSSCKE